MHLSTAIQIVSCQSLFAVMLLGTQLPFATLTSKGHFNGQWAELSLLPGEISMAIRWPQATYHTYQPGHIIPAKW